MVLETHPAIRPCVSPSEQPLRKCQVNPLPASPALSTRVCGPAIFTRYREIWWDTDEKWGSGGRWGNVLLFGREDFEKAVLLLGVRVELYKNTMLGSYFSFSYHLGKIPLCIYATCQEMDGKVWGTEGGWGSCGERKNKNNFCLENVMMSLNSM